MHEVCKNIRDPKLWEGVPPDRMMDLYLRRWDRRVTLAFAPERRVAVVSPREPLFAPERPGT
jgi:hypothetical protein